MSLIDGMEYGMEGECTQYRAKSNNWRTAQSSLSYTYYTAWVLHCRGFMSKLLLTYFYYYNIMLIVASDIVVGYIWLVKLNPN